MTTTYIVIVVLRRIRSTKETKRNLLNGISFGVNEKKEKKGSKQKKLSAGDLSVNYGI